MTVFDLQEEFKKNPDLKQEDFDHIKTWLSKQPHLPHVSDRHIVLFLHSCYFKLEQTKNTIDNYFTIRTQAPEIFSKRDPKSTAVQGALETISMAKLAGKSVDGYDIFMSRFKRVEPEHYIMADVVKAYNMHADICFKDSGTSPGLLYVVDMQGFSVGHMLKLNLAVMKYHINYLQDALPARLKGIHLLNCHSIIDTVMNMLKPIMKSELISLFHYHQANSTTLHEYVPKSILPKDYGGDAKTMNELAAETMKYFLDNVEWFVEEEQLRVDESKRQGKSKLKDELDMSGSFKKLSFD